MRRNLAASCLRCPGCQTQTSLSSIPVFDHVEILAEYTDGVMTTVPSASLVVAATCPQCTAIVFLPEPTDARAIPAAWQPVRDPKELAATLEALNCPKGSVELRWHLSCIQKINDGDRSPSLPIDHENSSAWLYLNNWVADFKNLEFASDASDIAEAYRRLGKFTECLKCLDVGTVIDRSRARRIETLARGHISALDIV